MKKKRYDLCGTYIVTSAICFWLMLSGCSEQPGATTDPYPEMSTQLRSLQGSWIDLKPDDPVECTAIFQGYTVRVRYQAAQDETVQKQNASIDRLDEVRKLILINGGAGAWPYDFIQKNETEYLYLEFYMPDGWHKLHLQRDE